MASNSRRVTNILKMLSFDMINKAGVGYPGFSLKCATLLYNLYSKILTINPKDPNWINRDRIIFSSHESASLVYSTLFMSGYQISINEIKNYGQESSKLSGQINYNINGIDASVGSQGEGICMGVGIALAEHKMANIMNINGKEIINFMTYVICDEKDIVSGKAHEALSYVGLLNLNKFVLIIDLDEEKISEKNIKLEANLEQRLESYGFNVYKLNGDNAPHMVKNLSKAKESKKPTAYIIHTSPGRDKIHRRISEIQNDKINEKDLRKIRKRLNVGDIPFAVLEEDKTFIESMIKERCEEKYNLWQKDYQELKETLTEEEKKVFETIENGKNNIDFKVEKFKINENYKEDLRKTNLDVMSIIYKKMPLVVSGSTNYELCNTKIKKGTMLSNLETNGVNIDFGFRKQAISGILNGLALCNFKVFSSASLNDLNFIIDSIKYSIENNLPTTYIFIEEGNKKTSEEYLNLLRSVSNNIVFRPADINELFGVWSYALSHKGAVSIVLNANVIPKLTNTNAKSTINGAYIIKKETNKIDGIIISSGKELHHAIILADYLAEENIEIRVVSMPSIELFLKQDKDYQSFVLPKNVPVIALEDSQDYHWLIFAMDPNNIISLRDNDNEYIDLSSNKNIKKSKILNQIKKMIVNHK